MYSSSENTGSSFRSWGGVSSKWFPVSSDVVVLPIWVGGGFLGSMEYCFEEYQRLPQVYVTELRVGHGRGLVVSRT